MKALDLRHDDLRKACLALASRMRLLADHERHEAAFENEDHSRGLRIANADYLDKEANALAEAAEGA